MTIIDLTCYPYPALNIILLETPLNKYHKLFVLIKSIKDILLENIMFRVIHILHERNQSDDFKETLEKLDASANVDLLIHNSPTHELSNILAANTTLTLFLRL